MSTPPSMARATVTRGLPPGGTLPAGGRSTPTGTAAGIPTPLPTTAIAFVKEAVTAKDVDPKTAAPVGAATTFGADQPLVYAVIRYENAPAGTTFKSVWYAIQSANPPLVKLHEATQQVPKESTKYSGYAYSSIKTPTLPQGKYRVEIYVDDKLARTIDFELKK